MTIFFFLSGSIWIFCDFLFFPKTSFDFYLDQKTLYFFDITIRFTLVFWFDQNGVSSRRCKSNIFEDEFTARTAKNCEGVKSLSQF